MLGSRFNWKILNHKMNKLRKYLTEIESKISQHESLNTIISKATVGWHIEHLLLTLDIITLTLRRSDSSAYKWKFNLMRLMVFITKKIPRGRAKSPDVVVPKGTITEETLRSHFEKTKAIINLLNDIPPNQYFEHPFFGKLNVKSTKIFLQIHTRHHLGIIKDILKN